MVSNYYVYQRIRDLAKTGTSGYQSIDEYNRDSEQVSNMLTEVLTDNYEGNGKAADALADLLVYRDDLNSDAFGSLTLPDDYLHLDSIGIIIDQKQYPFIKIMRNEVDTIMSSEVRRFNYAKKHFGYYKEAISVTEDEVTKLVGVVKLLPAQVYGPIFRYIRIPVTPFLELTPSGDEDDDYDVYDPDNANIKNFEFAPFMADLIVYLMLEKLGIEMKEQILVEYANLGISRGMIKTTPANV